MSNFKFYVTTEDTEKLRKTFLNFRFYALISVPDIIQEAKIDPDNLTDYSKFVINSIIKYKIEDCLKRKKYFAIIYKNDSIDYELIKNLTNLIKEYDRVEYLSLLDYKNRPQHENYWGLFSEVTFFPTTRKMKIIECEKINFLD